MSNDSEPQSKWRYSLRLPFVLVALLSVLLAIPVIGITLLSGVFAMVLFLSLLVLVQIPIFICIRRFLPATAKQAENDDEPI